MMVRRLFAVLLLVLMVIFVGCSEDEPEKVKPKKVVDEEMVLIPAGSFEMGDSKNEPEGWMESSRPVHTVQLDAFHMDVHEVTVGQYKQFVSATGHRSRPDWLRNYSPTDTHPVVGVSWNDATAYAQWAGKRLPTEAEWEYAARGGLSGKRYPWGDEIIHDDANYIGTGGKDQWDGTTAPVGSFKPNGYGLHDMAGNVWEWCADRYGWNYYATSSLKNPKGPDTGIWRVLRGGSWDYDANGLRAAYRDGLNPTDTNFNGGFRCVLGF